MKYKIVNKAVDDKYVIYVTTIVPPLTITNSLNFRVHKLKLSSGGTVSDPDIAESKYIHDISQAMFGKEKTFEFIFSPSEISNAKSIVLGFCDEMVKWYGDTYIDIPIDKALLAKTPENKETKLCILSTWDIKCGISQYCKNFHDAIVKRKFVTKVFEHTSSYQDVFSFIKRNNYNIFLVQYEPSIISDFDSLIKNIVELKRHSRDTKVFFVIHSESQDLTRLDGIIDGFIYHKNNTIPIIRSSVHKIPMGVPVFNAELTKSACKQKYGVDSDKIIISTVGFMFAWKQHSSVLANLAELLRSNSNIVVQLLTSFHSINNTECIDEYNKIQEVINSHGLKNQVIHITDYIPQLELNERLYMSDIGFLWSGIETTSSSASLKEFVSSRLPVVKTNSTHYHDIKTGCITTDQNMTNFVRAISDVVMDKTRLNRLTSEMESTYKDMNYDSIIRKFIEAFGA